MTSLTNNPLGCKRKTHPPQFEISQILNQLKASQLGKKLRDICPSPPNKSLYVKCPGDDKKIVCSDDLSWLLSWYRLK